MIGPVYRFAPSPTGRLHLGHGYSAWVNWRAARTAGGRFLLRIEDIDNGRSRAEFIDGILEDLTWLGLDWDGPVRRQSEHFSDYAAALELLREAGLLYPCFCTRKDIAADIAAAGGAPHGLDGPVYPGLCKHLPAAEAASRIVSGAAHAWRLHADRAIACTGPLTWRGQPDAAPAPVDPGRFGDIVLARKDTPASYHLAVVHDDALQGVTHVLRGADLLGATAIHRLLQALLYLPVPVYAHHALLLDATGERLAKRRGSRSLADLRESGISAQAIIRDFETGVGI